MSEIRRIIVRAVATMMAAAFVLGIAPEAVAYGPDNAKSDQQIQAMSVEVKKLEVLDKSHVATTEIGQADALRDKALSISAQRNQREELARTLEELEATVAVAFAKVNEAEKQTAIDAKRAKIAGIRKQTEDVRKRVAELEKQMGGAQ